MGRWISLAGIMVLISAFRSRCHRYRREVVAMVDFFKRLVALGVLLVAGVTTTLHARLAGC